MTVKNTFTSTNLKTVFLFALMAFTLVSPAQINVGSIPVVEKYVVGYNDVTKMKFINDAMLYKEGWQKLAQPKFWQQIMNLSPDSAIVSIGSNRKMLDRINIKEWNKLSDVQHTLYRDSVRKANNIPDSLNVLITIGKKDFYEFKKVMPTINRSIDVFKQNGIISNFVQDNQSLSNAGVLRGLHFQAPPFDQFLKENTFI